MNPLEKQLLFVMSRIHVPILVAPLVTSLRSPVGESSESGASTPAPRSNAPQES
jgi:hypothetical protein